MTVSPVRGASADIAAGPRTNSIGALRLLLAGLVIYGHAWYLGGFGTEPLARFLFRDAANFADIGVQGFFVLSGYLVLQSAQRSPGARAFLWNRGLRIYPGLWLCLLVTGLVLPGVVGAWRPPTEFQWREAASYVWRNLILPRTQIDIPGLFHAVPKPGDLNGSLWTLPYEIGCYVLLGAAAWLGVTRPRTFLPWLAGLALIGLYWFDVTFPAHALFFKSPGRRLAAWFVCGALFALVPEKKLRGQLKGWIALVAALGLLLSCRCGGFAQVGPFALAATMLWLAWHLPLPACEQRLRGDYSYGLYIYAYPVQQGLAHAGLTRWGISAYFLGSLLLTLPLAILSWHLVEKRALRLKARAVSLG